MTIKFEVEHISLENNMKKVFLDGFCHCPIPEPKKLIGLTKKYKPKLIKHNICSICNGTIQEIDIQNLKGGKQ